MENELRNAIKTELSKVQKKATPKVYEAISTESGYKSIEDMMINISIKENISLSASIPVIENLI